MIISRDPPVHLAYCLNVYTGETWEEIGRTIRAKTPELKRLVAPGQPFALGLRLSHAAVRALADQAARDAFKHFLREQGLYVFTINGFPYGAFHGQRVKEQVYQPDWRTPERCEYTKILAAVLADLLPEGLSGSISTVPCAFKTPALDAPAVGEMVQRLVETVAYLAQLEALTGRELHVGLEPEPGCVLETTSDAVTFFETMLLGGGRTRLQRILGCPPAQGEALLRRHLGICFDTCHLALQREPLEESVARLRAAGIRISKTQVSAAVEAPVTAAGLNALEAFSEPVYLHQVTAVDAQGSPAAWPDLPDALRALREGAWERARVHFHVPLFWRGQTLLSSTADEVTTSVLARLVGAGCRHFEIETYTFHVLPPALKAATLEEQMAREYQWLLDRFPGDLSRVH